MLLVFKPLDEFNKNFRGKENKIRNNEHKVIIIQ